MNPWCFYIVYYLIFIWEMLKVLKILNKSLDKYMRI